MRPRNSSAAARRLRSEAELAAQHDQDGFVAAMATRIREAVGELAESMEQAAPPDQLYLGLDRWRSKQPAT